MSIPGLPVWKTRNLQTQGGFDQVGESRADATTTEFRAEHAGARWRGPSAGRARVPEDEAVRPPYY